MHLVYSGKHHSLWGRIGQRALATPQKQCLSNKKALVLSLIAC